MEKFNFLVSPSRFVLKVLRVKKTSHDDQTYHNRRILTSSFHFWLNFYDRTVTSFYWCLKSRNRQMRFHPGGGFIPGYYIQNCLTYHKNAHNEQVCIVIFGHIIMWIEPGILFIYHKVCKYNMRIFIILI